MINIRHSENIITAIIKTIYYYLEGNNGSTIRQYAYDKKGKVKRSRIFYLRNLTGKSARIKEQK